MNVQSLYHVESDYEYHVPKMVEIYIAVTSQ